MTVDKQRGKLHSSSLSTWSNASLHGCQREVNLERYCRTRSTADLAHVNRVHITERLCSQPASYIYIVYGWLDDILRDSSATFFLSRKFAPTWALNSSLRGFICCFVRIREDVRSTIWISGVRHTDKQDQLCLRPHWYSVSGALDTAGLKGIFRNCTSVVSYTADVVSAGYQHLFSISAVRDTFRENTPLNMSLTLLTQNQLCLINRWF